ncbi:Hypothetical protein, putative [Bodo saltans]|uniref:Uncharacterized protein n=1 Tax=Bodo saltans TaxID=75058 RepID=A0A0S4ILK8_BODSA|nr:Hypothetical protein, putative [Bodo saltans]|eukprot:CUF26424.1 Hypothetical protein, putative [Bodo saltans]
MQLPDIELTSRGGNQPECVFSILVTPRMTLELIQEALQSAKIGDGETVALVSHVRRASFGSPQGPSFATFEAATALMPTGSNVHKVIDCDGSVTFFDSVARSVRAVKSKFIVVSPTATSDISLSGGFFRSYVVPRFLKSTPEEVIMSHFTNLRLYGCGLYFPRRVGGTEVRLTVVLNLDRILFMDCPAVMRVALRAVKATHVKLLGRFTPPAIPQSGEPGMTPDGESWNEVFRKQRQNCEELLQGLQKYIPETTTSTTKVCTVDEAMDVLREELKAENSAVAFQRHSSALLGDSSASRARSFVWRDENERFLKECILHEHASVVAVL